MVRHSVRPATYEGYERMVRLHAIPAIDSNRLARLNGQLLTNFYRRLLEKGVSPKYVRLIHAMLHRALSQALRWGLVGSNAASVAEPPRMVRKEFPTLSAEQAQKLLELSRSDRFHALFAIALSTGMRQGELFGMRWADVDLEREILAVRQQVYRLRGGWVYCEPKTAKGRRTLPLPSFAVETLREHRTRQLEERLRAGPEWEDNDLVFPNHVGKPMAKQNLIRRHFLPLLQRASLSRIRFHDLRHCVASILLTQGVHPKVVQERLGHATINITMDLYSHVMPTLQREAAEQLDRLFSSGQNRVAVNVAVKQG